jgi:large subunit ribosomal protein L19e
MNLEKKKAMAARVLGVGKSRVSLNKERLSEIKEAITKQDIRDLFSSGAIFVKEIKGRRKVVSRKNRRRAGSVRKPTIVKKKDYMILTRKLRAYLYELKRKEKITPEQYLDLRKKIRASIFRSKSHLKEVMALGK